MQKATVSRGFLHCCSDKGNTVLTLLVRFVFRFVPFTCFLNGYAAFSNG